MSYKIFEHDPLLLPYEKDIELRMDNYFKNTTAVIEQFNIAVDCCYDDDEYDKNAEFIKIVDFELAKALVLDNRGMALKVAQMILAYHGINDVKVKFE